MSCTVPSWLLLNRRAGGSPRVVFGFTIENGKITGIEMIADAERIGGLDVEYLAG
jgi:hypothetical protein